MSIFFYYLKFKTHLYAQDAKNNEKRATNQYDVPNWFKRRNKRLDDQFQAWCPVDDPQRPQASQKAEDAENVEYSRTGVRQDLHSDVHQ